MTDNEMNEFNSAVRMIDFNKKHPDVFKNNVKMTGGFAALDIEVNTLEAAGANRVSSKGMRSDGTADKRAAKAALSKVVRKMVDTAKLIKKEEPEFENVFKIRRGTLSGQELLDAARAFADDLTEPIAEKFSDFGTATATAENLTAKVGVFQAAREQQNAGKGGGVAATAETKGAMKRLMQKRRMLKKIGENILDEMEDAGLEAEWDSACHVEKRGAKNSGTPDQPPTT